MVVVVCKDRLMAIVVVCQLVGMVVAVKERLVLVVWLVSCEVQRREYKVDSVSCG